MSDYVLNTYVWNLGHDEADELAEEIADVLARRGLAFVGNEDDPMKSIVSLCQIDFSNTDGDALSPEEIFQIISAGSRLLLIPQATGDKHERHRALDT